MKPKPKRNVQAQRKFAQGAYIPPTNHTIERRRDMGHRHYNTRNIVRKTRINMSAASLLDRVTFKSLYPHLQPVVLIKRLKLTSVKVSTRNRSLPKSPSRDHRLRVMNGEHNNNIPVKIQQRITRSKSQCSMSTRSRSSFRTARDVKEKPEKKRVIFPDNFSIDDNRPLMFFANNFEARRPPSHAGYESDSDVDVLTRTASNQEQSNTAFDKHERERVRRTRFAGYQAAGTITDMPRTVQRTKHVRDENTSANSTHIERERVRRKRSAGNQPASTIKCMSRTIQRSKHVEEETPWANTAHMIDTDVKPSVRLEEPQTDINNSCPSQRYFNAKDVFAATREELNNRCRTCTSCESVNKLLQIASLVEQSLSISQGETNDVYQFDGNESFSFKYTDSHPSSVYSPSNINSVPIYLDVMSEDCTHVIQIIWDEKNNKMLRARLVPKSQANINNELSLNGHGNLLDQFINRLNESSKLRMCKLQNDPHNEFEKILQNDVQLGTEKFKTGIKSNQGTTDAPEPLLTNGTETQQSHEQHGTIINDERVDNINDNVEPDAFYNLEESLFRILELGQTASEEIGPGQLQVEQGTSEHDDPQTENLNESALSNNIEVSHSINQNKSTNVDAESLILATNTTTSSESKIKKKALKNSKICISTKIGVKGSHINKKILKSAGQSRRQSSRLIAKKKEPERSSKRLLKSAQNRVHSLALGSASQNTLPNRKSVSKPCSAEKYESAPTSSSSTTINQPSTSRSNVSVAQRSRQKIRRRRRISDANIKFPHDLNIIENSDSDSTSSESFIPLQKISSSIPLFRNAENNAIASSNNREGPGSRNSFPRGSEKAELVNALVFHPTVAEFADPISYFEKIMPIAKKFGLCKVVPPDNFNPTCHIKDEMRFSVSNQYIARMYSRWGVAQREMCAIKVNSASQGVVFNKAPLLDSMEVNLLKLYHLVQHNGGLKKVIEKKRWTRIAEDLRVNRCLNPEKKLDFIYVKYVLSYDTLTNEERQKMLRKVESCWYKYNMKMLERSMNPLHLKKKVLGESDSSEDEEEEMDRYVASALAEAEECVVDGRQMNLRMFKKIAVNMMYVHFPNMTQPSVDDVENEYWRIVLLAAEHVCVNVASIDSGPQGFGFTKNKNDSYGRHPWNLKVLCQNPSNVLRSLNSVLGVTAPTLHLGMCFSCSCWHRDPHGLPWMEYMHSGPGKIWYGIPDEQSDNFRKAVETLCPTSFRNKSIWLPSDITMIPPNLLREHNVSLSRVVQNPGEFIIVFPKAYSCSISTGYTQSESAYFANNSWLASVKKIFQELRESCEPTAFSLEQLLMSVACDQRVSLTVLQQVHGSLTTVIYDELSYRQTLVKKGVKIIYGEIRTRTRQRGRGWNSRNDECRICRCILYLSKVMGIITKKCQLCLQHAVTLLNVTGSQVNISQVELILPFTDEELKEVISDVEERLTHF